MIIVSIGLIVIRRRKGPLPRIDANEPGYETT